MKQSKFPYLLMLIIMVFGGAYLRGWRIITLEEVPNSHRPVAVFLSAAYTMDHFSPAEQQAKSNSVFDVLGANE